MVVVIYWWVGFFCLFSFGFVACLLVLIKPDPGVGTGRTALTVFLSVHLKDSEGAKMMSSYAIVSIKLIT